MTISGAFQHSRNLPSEKRLENLRASQARWVEMYGEENENLKLEIKKLKQEVENERSANSNPNNDGDGDRVLGRKRKRNSTVQKDK